MGFRSCFKCLYEVYNSSIGKWLHNCVLSNRHHRRIRSDQGQEHSHVDLPCFEFEEVRIRVVPLARTNYSYIVQDKASGKVAIIDPGDAYYLRIVVETEFRQPVSVIAVTHRHWDHSAGIGPLLAQYPDCRSYAHHKEAASSITNPSNDGDIIMLGLTEITVLHTPGHTEGSACYLINQRRGRPLLFTGDTMFLGGMGAFFEGTARGILLTIERIRELPGETLVFPGHEYSDTTLRFAKFIEPHNPDVLRKCAWVEMRRRMHFITIPSTISEERSYNPFLRIKTESLRMVTKAHASINVLVTLQNFRVTKRREFRNVQLVDSEESAECK